MVLLARWPVLAGRERATDAYVGGPAVDSPPPEELLSGGSNER